MKKENEVLQAAENGNVTKLECLFEQRQAKVFAGFFKGPNINWRNENGCTALHLAALNGHQEAVIFLLHNDASANTPDNAGSFPLHLAAFNGHAEIARILIERGPSKARVNEHNMTGDSALHVAAQYNHHTVMDVLLKHHADIFLRNAKEETALDLAAQYGRFYAVQMLVFKDLTILKEAVHKHSPLHLSARNGHVKVVRLLLDSGMPINAVCDMGTALHTAALFGKVEVAKLLLKRGINIEIENGSNEKVLDLLCKTPSQISQQITALIYEHSGLISDDSVSETTSQRSRVGSMPSTRKQLSTYDYVNKISNANDANDCDGASPYVMVKGIGKTADRLSNYDGFNLTSVTGKKENDDPYCLLTEGNYRQLDYSSKGSIKQKPTNSNKIKLRNNDLDNQYIKSDGICLQSETTSPKFVYPEETTPIYDVPPKFDEKRLSQLPVPDFPPPSPGTASSIVTDVIKRSAMLNTNKTEDDKSYSTFNNKQQAMLTDAANNLLGIKSLSKSVPINIGMSYVDHTSSDDKSSYDSYNNVTLKNTPTKNVLDNYDNINLCPTVKLSSACDPYDNVNLTQGQARSNYDNIQLKNVPASINYDTKHNEIKGKSIKQRRTIIKRDILVDQDNSGKNNVMEHCPYTEMSPGKVSSPLDSSKIYGEEIHLNKVTVLTSIKADIPLDNTSNEGEESALSVSSEETPIPKPRTKVKQSRTSVRNVYQDYRMSDVQNQIPLDESYEWNKIDKFVSELELFAEQASPSEDEIIYKVNTDNISAWLNSFGLFQYEPMFLTNGFDDIAFLNGVLSDEDLLELGIIHSEHRKKILEASSELPKSPVMGDVDFPFPNNISEWLAKLKLCDYERRFIHYGYDNMERISVIWELELVSVLDITIIGHYKRMLTSLGKPKFKKKDVVSWGQKFADADAGRNKVEPFVDDSIDVAKQLWETAESLKVERRQRQSISTKKDNEKHQTWEATLIKNEEESITPETLHESEWIHNSDILLHASVFYTMKYLGSHPVQQVIGVTSTLEACTKMKTISKNIRKMPSVTLSISVRGIDYIDSNSKMVIIQYPINNISHCAQDPDELNIFAYITRDEFTRKHYCHVFKVSSVELADEIIITIGQCFEIAYKLYLETIPKNENSVQQEKSENVPNVPTHTTTIDKNSARNGTFKNNKLSVRKPGQTSIRKPPLPPKPFTVKDK